MKISELGIALIKSFEGCRLVAYKTVNTEKYYTIGWGHYGADVKAGQIISQAEADALFLSDLQRFVKYTNHYTAFLNLNQNQFDALVSFCYNAGPGKLNTLVSGRMPKEIAEHFADYCKSGGKVLNGLVKRREKEKELFCKGSELKNMAIKVGSARIDENGKISGGIAGDQTGKEVSTQDFYLHSKGWYLIRPKSVEDANKLASAMQAACENDNIGYDQSERLGIITQIKKYGSMFKIPVKTEADCGTLVRGCCIEAGFDPGNFTTAEEAVALSRTGKFEGKVAVTSSTILYNGDILVTKTKGHTVIVVSGNPRKKKGDLSSSVSCEQKKEPEKAKAFDKSIAGRYRVKEALNLRLGAGKTKTSVVIMKQGETIICYGYYTLSNNERWYLVQYGRQTGYCSSNYLERIYAK